VAHAITGGFLFAKTPSEKIIRFDLQDCLFDGCLLTVACSTVACLTVACLTVACLTVAC
jgi:hypothetical protein